MNQMKLSKWSRFAKLPKEKRIAFLKTLSNEQLKNLQTDWQIRARPDQLPPKGDWRVWLLMAGRGFGKTRTGAEYIKYLVESGDYKHISIVGQTAADTRDVMMSMLLNIYKDHPNEPEYIPSRRIVIWPNGAVGHTFSAEEPDQLRGHQFDAAWCDELAKWPNDEAWNNLKFCLRIGNPSRCVVTTTPRGLKWLKRIVDDPNTVITKGSTMDNIENLEYASVMEMDRMFKGTRLGRQEFYGELLMDVEGALWKVEDIDNNRMSEKDFNELVQEKKIEIIRKCVAIDPAVSSSEDADEHGIIVAAVDSIGHGYILHDATVKGTPDKWAKAAIRAWNEYETDIIIGEVNNGGEMIGMVINETLKDFTEPLKYRFPNYKQVRASHGKVARAEPISLLYEQGKVHHVGNFHKLEDQLCSMTLDFNRRKGNPSPDRLDALVWALTELMVVEDRSIVFGRLN